MRRRDSIADGTRSGAPRRVPARALAGLALAALVAAAPGVARAAPPGAGDRRCLAPAAGDVLGRLVRDRAFDRVIPAGWRLHGASLGEDAVRLDFRGEGAAAQVVVLELAGEGRVDPGGGDGSFRPEGRAAGDSGAPPAWTGEVRALVAAAADPWPTVPCGGVSGEATPAQGPTPPGPAGPGLGPHPGVPRALYLALGLAQLLALAAWTAWNLLGRHEP